ncbi:hypothetical protein HZC35_04810 [Candidatus Saganbacteria bacterium]|nr:hypothetical protein [Candidatus Saganbacteria bacterium]
MSEKQEKLFTDIRSLAKNYSEAANQNKILSNNIYIEFVKQSISIMSLYLIFIATMFFFLENKLNLFIIMPMKIWLLLAVISAFASIILSLATLWIDKTYLLHGAEYYLYKSAEARNYIQTTGNVFVETIPDSLLIDPKIISPWKSINWLLIMQGILFIIVVFSTTASIIGSIIK